MFYVIHKGIFLLTNIVQISVNHTADWWLGDLEDYWFKALQSAVHEEWGVEPLRIREGGVSVFCNLDLSRVLT